MNAETQDIGATRALAGFASTLNYEAIPPAIIACAKTLLLDGLACLVAGIRGGPGRSAAATVKRLGGNPQCTIFIGGFKGSVRDAAFANAVTLYSIGLNDIHKPSTSHPGGCIIAPILAVAEWRQSGGRDMLAAMVAGYDVNSRLGTAIMPSHRERGFHPTGTIGTFGATGAVGRMLGLDADELASAMGIAGSQATGLYEFHHDGTLTMIFHAGRAAQNGVEACLLVQDGLSGPATVLEGSKGFCQAMSTPDLSVLTRDLGRKFYIEETSFRPYYGCASTIAASGAMETILKRRDAGSSDVAAVEVRCHPVVFRDNGNANPRTLLAARLSMQYNVALVLHRGEVFTADLTEDELWNPAIRGEMAKVSVVADETMPRFGSVVTARFGQGELESEPNLVPRGDASAPLNFADVAEKFRRMTKPVAPPKVAERVIDLVDHLENASGPELAAALAEATAGG